MIKRFTLFILMTALFSFTLTAIQAEESAPASRIGYFLAADDNGIQQVYQWVQETGTSRQLTHASTDVAHFGVAYDGLSVAYVSGSRLFLQPIHTEEAEALATLADENYLGDPVYSPDGQYIAYTDNGVWLLDLATRETRELVANVPLIDGSTNADKYRLYAPLRFVTDAEGNTTHLILDIGVWEWNTSGVYDLATNTLQEFETNSYPHLNSDILVLADGYVLFYGNSPADGSSGLHETNSVDNISSYNPFRILDFLDITDQSLWAERAVELTPGTVRIFGRAFNSDAPGNSVFFFDYDVDAHKAGEVHFLLLDETGQRSILTGPLSADGQIASVYFDANYDSFNTVEGDLVLLDLATGQPVAEDFPELTGLFRWQPQQ